VSKHVPLHHLTRTQRQPRQQAVILESFVKPSLLAQFSRAFALVFVITGCGYSLDSRLPDEVTRVESIEPALARERKLDFIKPVRVAVDTPEQAQKAIANQITRDHTDEELSIGGESGAMTGLYPPDIDLKLKTLQLMHDQVVAFYDPDAKQMVIVEGRNGSAAQRATTGAAMDELVIAHELTHALQDQHFGIQQMLERVKNNDDKTLALKCVAEGDATLAAFGLTAGGLRTAALESTLKRLAALSINPPAEQHDMPLAVVMPMLFEYSAGSRFVAEAWRHGGWKAVNQLYRHPPLSSQQIIHPELYFNRPTPPIEIELAGYNKLLEGWKKVDDDTYGELLLELLLRRNLPFDAPALSVVARWAGDRIITLQKGGQLTLLWVIAFHDEASAQQFAHSYSRILAHLGGSSNPHGVATRSAAVFVAIGPGVRDFSRLSEAVWKMTKIGAASVRQAAR